MAFSPLFSRLINSLRALPGVGQKSAQRMALYLLTRDKAAANEIAHCIQEALEKMGRCNSCNTLSEVPICALCSNPRRDPHLLCIVETPADVLALEQTASFRGLYYVLMGHLSPLDGIGPDQLNMSQLAERLRNPELTEVILATNPTVEGEATAHYIATMAQSLPLKITRIAHGVPLGGELEFIDLGTLSRALLHREEVL